MSTGTNLHVQSKTHHPPYYHASNSRLKYTHDSVTVPVCVYRHTQAMSSVGHQTLPAITGIRTFLSAQKFHLRGYKL